MRNIFILLILFFTALFSFVAFPKTALAADCTSGGSWSDYCNPDNPNAKLNEACGPQTGTETRILDSGSKNCKKVTKTRRCDPKPKDACASNLCSQGKCVQCKVDDLRHCSANEECKNNTCVQKQQNNPPPQQQPTCDKSQPSLSVDPGNRNGKPGEERVYDITVINNDKNNGGNVCENVNFVLSVSLPNESWTGTFNDANLSIGPNSSKPTKLHVKAPKSANEGVKAVVVSVRKQVNEKGTSVHVSYTVDPEPQPAAATNTPIPENKPPDNGGGGGSGGNGGGSGGNNDSDPGPSENQNRSALVMGISLYGGVSPQEGRENQTLSEIDAFAKSVGQYPGTFSIWNNFGDYGGTSDGSSTAFPSKTLLDGLDQRGITPVIFMQPVGAAIHLPQGANPNNPPQGALKYSNKEITKGSFNAYLTAWAKDAKAYGKTVILRYAHEMNGHWFPWSEWKESASNGRSYYNVGNTAENYIAAWRQVYKVIKEDVGANNVKFLWAPWAGAPERWYPGNKYVDYVGFDEYDALEKDKSMADLYAPIIAKLRELSNKKIIVAETGVDERFANPKRSDWLKNGISDVYTRYSDVLAVIYFNFSQWNLWSSSEIASTWANVSSDARFQGRFKPATVVAVPGDPTPTPPGNDTGSGGAPADTGGGENTGGDNSGGANQGGGQDESPIPLPPTNDNNDTTNPPREPDETILSFSVGLDSIGTTGTSTVATFNNSNKNPKRPTRNLAVNIFNAQNALVKQVTSSLNYVSDTKSSDFGKFVAAVAIGKDFSGADYIIKIKTDGFLEKQISGIQQIKANVSNTIPKINLIAGDINSDDRIDILDYNYLMSCSIFAKTESIKSACNSSPNYKTLADINDDGIVNELDYGYFIQEFSVKFGD
ncbi:MAG: hypothetical protein HY344_00895 [Candidatus Levybacteria bacterium]|nr:hypothetical protein [Candidatus Levybacteria bacterium]